jgi:hypothetical protein
MGQMQKKLKLKANDFFFSKNDQLDLPKLRQIMFLIRWCNLTWFLCIEVCFELRNQIWKNFPFLKYQVGHP